ncbi:MAG: hypothetical protein ACREVY_03665 [Gammaproteobacteria bacterium]
MNLRAEINASTSSINVLAPYPHRVLTLNEPVDHLGGNKLLALPDSFYRLIEHATIIGFLADLQQSHILTVWQHQHLDDEPVILQAVDCPKAADPQPVKK